MCNDVRVLPAALIGLVLEGNMQHTERQGRKELNLPLDSGKWNLTAKPLGLAPGSVSGMVGPPVEEEKRTVMGVEDALKWVALVSSLALEEGVNVPVRT